MVRKFRNIKKVGGDSGHNLANLGLVEVGERRSEKMGEQILTHILFNFNTHTVTYV